MNVFMSFRRAAAAGALLFMVGAAPTSAGASDAIKQKIIKASIASYPGNCPCPYNVDRGGRSCGKRSAWSRGGGYAPKCFASDISAAEVRLWKAGG